MSRAEHLERAIRDYLAGEYERNFDRPGAWGRCAHGKGPKESCERCIDAHFQRALETAPADVADAVAAEKERCARIADAFADENIRMCGDTILIDPVLNGSDRSDAGFVRSESLQTDGVIHSAMFHAAQNIAAAIRQGAPT